MEFTDQIGFEYVTAEQGRATIGLQLEPRHMSRAERAHGGVLFSLLDSAMGGAVLSTLPAGRGCATLEMKINFFRPVQRGRLTAVGSVHNRTRNIAYAEGEITDGEGKMVARATATFFLTATLKQSERERV